MNPQEVKQSLIADEAEWAKSVGLPVDVSRMDQEWTESLERVSKRQAEQDAKPRVPTSRQADAAKKMAEKDGYTFRKAATIKDAKGRELAAVDKVRSLKERHLEYRIRCMMEYKRDDRGKLIPVFPEYQRRIINIHFAAKNGQGEYKGKCYADKGRIAGRELEDLADASVRWLGEWR